MGDQLFVSSATGTFDNANAGTGKIVAITDINFGGTSAGNYKPVTSSQATGDIYKKEVTVSGITALNKTHDGNAEATLAFDKVVINGMVQGDSLTVTATGAFENSDAGTGKTVHLTNIAISGASAGNYVLATTGNQETAVADITATCSTSQPLDGVLIAAMVIAGLAVLAYIGYAAKKS